MRHTQRGLTLIEVLIAMLVLGVGLVGIAKYQGILFKDSGTAKERTAAVMLAERKIEDLRGFTDVYNAINPLSTNPRLYVNYTGTLPCTAASCTGGAIRYGTTTVSDIPYNLQWTVNDCYAGAANAGPCAAGFGPVPPAGALYPDYKDVTVYVDWTGPVTVHTVTLHTVLDSIPPRFTDRASAAPGFAPAAPQVPYTPDQAPDVAGAAIGVGEGLKKETTRPVAEVQSGKYTLVKFEAITYGGTLASTASFFQTVRREEFVTANCDCRYAGQGLARPPAYPKWDAERQTFVDTIVSLVPKTVGTPAPAAPGEELPVICTACCRDHHDFTAAGDPRADIKYNNSRTDLEFSGDHVHYTADLVPVSPGNSSTTYVEACRFKRIDGVLHVFQDWRLKTLTVMPSDFLTTPPEQQSYINYVTSYVRWAASGIGSPPSKPTGRDISLEQGASEQLASRAIYVDPLTPEHVNFVVSNLASSSLLGKIPFIELNVTKLADWQTTAVDQPLMPLPNHADCGTTTQPSGRRGCVASEPINNFGEYLRGVTVAGDSNGTIDVQSFAQRSNTGITDTPAVYPSTVFPPLGTNQQQLTDQVTLSVGPTANPTFVNGVIFRGADFKASGDPVFSWTTGSGTSFSEVLNVTFSGGGGNGSGTCTVAVPVDNATRSYTCEVGLGWSGTILMNLPSGAFCESGAHSGGLWTNSVPGQSAGSTVPPQVICP